MGMEDIGTKGISWQQFVVAFCFSAVDDTRERNGLARIAVAGRQIIFGVRAMENTQTSWFWRDFDHCALSFR